MTTGSPTPEPTYATAAAVAGLAREVEGLRRATENLTGQAERLDQLAGLVARLAVKTATRATPPAGGVGMLTWLDLPSDPTAPAAALEVTRKTLADLTAWIGTVYVRYADAARALPACWLWHPEVVEELLWLHLCWLAAYGDPEARPTAAGDWHDRYRPGVVRRIREYAGDCSLENHDTGRPRHTLAPPVPVAAAADAIAEWWTTARAGVPPVPTPDDLAEAATLRPRAGTRNGRPRT